MCGGGGWRGLVRVHLLLERQQEEVLPDAVPAGAGTGAGALAWTPKPPRSGQRAQRNHTLALPSQIGQVSESEMILHSNKTIFFTKTKLRPLVAFVNILEFETLIEYF